MTEANEILLKQIKYDNFEILREHKGIFNSTTEDFGFNSLVISGHCMGSVPDYKMVGRLLQIRKSTGQFGSDTILVRLMDGSIMSFENQSFNIVSDEYKEFYGELMSDVKLDEPNIEYSIMDEDKATGFVVPEKQVKRNRTLDELL